MSKDKKEMQTIKLQGKDYAPVKERIKAFHDDHKNGSILTNWFTAFEGEKNSIISFKATVVPNVENEDRVFTGHALGKIQNEKAFEKLETIAVGRALANAGYLADGDVASSDEMERFFQQDNPNDVQLSHENPSNTSNLPEKVRHLADRYPFDKTLKAPKDDHRPYLNDGSEEFRKVEEDVRDGTLDPRYVRYFYTVTNREWNYLAEIPEQMKELDEYAKGNLKD